MPVTKTGAGKALGSVSYKSWDGYVTTSSYSVDSASPPLLWRKMGVGQEKVDTEGEAAVSLETAIGQLEAYKAKGVDVDKLMAAVKKAAPKDPAEIIAAEKAAQQQAAAEADY